MKQIVQELKSGKTCLREVPVPQPGPGMALVRNAASLVSAGTERMLVDFAGKSLVGKARSRPDLVRQTIEKAKREGVLTTLQAVQTRLDQPMPLGYSSAGAIVAVGEDLTGFQVGDRVACAGGGYAVHAEYIVVPKNLMTRLPDGVDFESAAFTTLGAIALHAIRLASLQVGERVAIIGLGLLGQLGLQIARAAGCEVFGVDLDLGRVALARGFGAHAVPRAEAEEAAQAASHSAGFDAVLICADTTSNDPIELAGRIARDRGRVVAVGAVGMDIPRKIYYDKELNLLVSRSYGPGRYDSGYEEGGQDYPIGYVRWTEGRNLKAVVEMMAAGQLEVQPLITHRFPIESGLEAYDLIMGKKDEHFLGVLLLYPREREEAEVLPTNQVRIRAETRASLPVRLGVLGAGNFANATMLPALKRVAGVECVGVADATALKAQHAGERFGFQYATTEENQLLQDEKINTIVVLTRHNLHASQVIAGLKAGKHVFCEKPLALHREELKTILEALQGSSQLLGVGFNRRFAPMSQHLKDFFSAVQQPLLMHYRVNAGLLPPNHWLNDPQVGGGRIIGEGCHFIDFLAFLSDSNPVSVGSRGLAEGEEASGESFILVIEFADGSIGTVMYAANGDRAFPKERVEVFGGGRVAVLDDFRKLEMFAHGKRKLTRSWLRQDKGHQAEWEAFSKALSEGGPPPIPYTQLFAVSMASFAAVESLREQRTLAVEALI
jgi:predicted dehydrogenase/threonine dehydrogenase-like Zn-dependent dehydrogenase